MRPTDPRKLANQAVMLHVVYGSFESAKLGKKEVRNTQS